MRHLHQVPLGGNERFLSFDAEANLPVLDDPPSTSIGMELAGRLGAGGHGNVVGVERAVVDDSLRPVGLALVLREQVGKLPDGLVRRDPGVGLHG